jgi:hypothetical protein
MDAGKGSPGITLTMGKMEAVGDGIGDRSEDAFQVLSNRKRKRFESVVATEISGKPANWFLRQRSMRMLVKAIDRPITWRKVK